MADFNIEESKRYQNELVMQARLMRDEIQRDLIDYYTEDRVDGENDAAENLRGMHRYFKDIYRKIDRILIDIERKIPIND